MSTLPPVSSPEATDAEMLEGLRQESFGFFRNEVNPQTGLTADKSQPGSPSSIASVGMALSVNVAAVERNLLSRPDAINRTLTVLRFLQSSRQGPEPETSGYKGFYYHFLDMQTGLRAWHCELSTIDTAILMAGILTAATYFNGPGVEERELRDMADSLYRRVDWQWALDGGTTLTHGWRPESGFLPCRWDNGYSEALILYVLALGAPDFPINPQAYQDWISTFEWKTIYGIEHLYAGPLFIHQMPHLWIDFRGIHDDFNRKTGIDYFENTRRATYVQRQYGIENPLGFAHYHEFGWGLTASDGPGPVVLTVDGVQRTFFDYIARGAPFGPDDGTISPWAVVTSLPFAPEIVITTIRHALERLKSNGRSPYSLDSSFNLTYPVATGNVPGWVSPWIFGLNQGPILLMIENFESELIWKIIRRCPYIVNGIRQAGFRGGWLKT